MRYDRVGLVGQVGHPQCVGEGGTVDTLSHVTPVSASHRFTKESITTITTILDFYSLQFSAKLPSVRISTKSLLKTSEFLVTSHYSEDFH